jgi:hypothetical protein
LRPAVAVVLGLLVAIVLLLCVVAYQLTRSSLGVGFLRGQIETVLRERLPGDAAVSIGSAAISYRPATGLRFEARSVQLAVPGRAALDIAQIATNGSVDALLAGKLDLRTVEVRGATITVEDAADLPPASSQADLIRRAAASFADVVGAVDARMRQTGLQEVAVRDSRLVWAGLGSPDGKVFRIADASWAPVTARRSKGWVEIQSENAAHWRVVIEREATRLGSAGVVVRIQDLPIATIAPTLADPERRPFHSAAIGGEARIVTGRDGRLSALRGMISSGPGRLAFSRDDNIQIAGTLVTFDLPPTGNILAVPRAEVRTARGRMAFEAFAELPENGAPVRLSGRVLGGALPTGKAEPAMLPIRGGVFRGHLDFGQKSLEIERLDLATGAGDLSLIGHAGIGGSAPGLSFALSFGELPAAALRALWPPFVAAKTRKWFDENVRSATFGPATLQVALPAEFIGTSGRTLPSYAVTGSAPFRDAEFSPLRTFPPLRGATGSIGFADAAATVTAHSGIVGVAGQGDVDAAGTTLVIRELGQRNLRGDLFLRLSGPAAAIAILSDTPPLGIAAKRGIKGTDLSGNAQVALDADVPLFENASEELKPSFRLALTDFASKSPIEGRLVSEADLIIEGTPDSYTIKGAGRLDGMEAAVDLVAGNAAQSQTDVTVTLDEAARKQLGLDFGDMLSGPVKASMKHAEGETDPQAIVLDLKDARVRLPFLGWEKGPGVPATAHFKLVKHPDGATDVQEITVAGKGFSAKGSLSIGADGKLSKLDFPELALRPGDRLSASAAATDGGYDIRVSGDSLDARGLLTEVRSGFGQGGEGGKGGAKAQKMRVTLKLASVRGQNETTLSDVEGSLALTGSRVDRVALQGRSGDSGAFEWVVGKDGEKRVMQLIADNGGAIIRFLGIYAKLAGGSLVIDYSGSADETGSGSMVMRNFRVINEGALAPAIRSTAEGSGRSASAVPVQQQIDPSDLRFDHLTVPFRRDGWVLSIDDAFLRGAAIGATASGTVNLPDRKLALSGTFVPAFGLNNIASAIPIFGGILGGGKNEGLLGITYKLFGPLDAPQLAMNPLSAVAPGIFRRIFEYQ